MDLENAARVKAILSRDTRFSGPILRRRRDDARLLPARLPRASPETEEHALLRVRRRRGRRRVPPVPALPPGNRAGLARVGRDVRDGFARTEDGSSTATGTNPWKHFRNASDSARGTSGGSLRSTSALLPRRSSARTASISRAGCSTRRRFRSRTSRSRPASKASAGSTTRSARRSIAPRESCEELRGEKSERQRRECRRRR